MASKKKIVIDPRLVDLFVDTWNEMSNSYVTRNTINSGWCYQIAIVFRRIYGGKLISSEYAHAWIRVGGKDYDSEHLEGIDRLKKCGWWTIQTREVVPMPEFTGHWDRCGNSGKVRLDIIKEVVKRYRKMTKEEAA